MLSSAWAWAKKLCRGDGDDPAVLIVKSIAPGYWGLGSELDVFVILRETGLSPWERYGRFAPEGSPVPSDLMAFSLSEWQRMDNDHPSVIGRWRREAIVLVGALPGDG